jgi:5-(carboxyamino)imidazole ribonucleotide mutase
MPAGVPVATVALDGAKNAGILAAEIIGTFDESVAEKLEQHKNALKTKVQEMKIS